MNTKEMSTTLPGSKKSTGNGKRGKKKKKVGQSRPQQPTVEFDDSSEEETEGNEPVENHKDEDSDEEEYERANVSRDGAEGSSRVRDNGVAKMHRFTASAVTEKQPDEESSGSEIDEDGSDDDNGGHRGERAQFGEQPKKKKKRNDSIVVSSGSSLSQSSTLTPEQTLQLQNQLESLRRKLNRATKKIEDTEKTNEILKAKAEMWRASSRKKTTSNRKGTNEAVNMILRRVREGVKKKVLRYVKFKEKNWDVWSISPTSVCGMLQPYMDWPEHYSEDDKVRFYYDNIQPYLGEILVQQRNVITQALRQAFISECCESTTTLTQTVYLPFFLSFLSYTEHESAGNNVDMHWLEKRIKIMKPADFINDTRCVEEFVNFLCVYGRLGMPKSMVNIWVQRMYQKHQESMPPLGETSSKWEGCTQCFLDMLTKYDLAYALWQCINSFDDWTRKRKLKSGKRPTTETRWTRDSKDSREEESGVDCYERLLEWVGAFKKLEIEEPGLLDDFRVKVNTVAEDMGYMREEGTKARARATNWDEWDDGKAKAVEYELDGEGVDIDVLMEAV